jgi:hypothetical protein
MCTTVLFIFVAFTFLCKNNFHRFLTKEVYGYCTLFRLIGNSYRVEGGDPLALGDNECGQDGE